MQFSSQQTVMKVTEMQEFELPVLHNHSMNFELWTSEGTHYECRILKE